VLYHDFSSKPGFSDGRRSNRQSEFEINFVAAKKYRVGTINTQRELINLM
jgi:hypothetical protein